MSLTWGLTDKQEGSRSSCSFCLPLLGFTKERTFAKGQVMSGLSCFLLFPLGSQSLAGQLRYHCWDDLLDFRFYFPFFFFLSFPERGEFSHNDNETDFVLTEDRMCTHQKILMTQLQSSIKYCILLPLIMTWKLLSTKSRRVSLSYSPMVINCCLEHYVERGSEVASKFSAVFSAQLGTFKERMKGPGICIILF